MCGITGWIDWERDLTLHPSILENMTETMAARGPDASGNWISTHCALGHRRLSVIDPDNGAQPMIRKQGDDSYVLVYNGELYNAPELRNELQQRGYKFISHCDTEVLLNAFIEWGPSCVERFNGIFAFAAWNSREQSLFLARDRLGVKPLFYSNQNNCFLFGSEPKAILAHPTFQAVIDAVGLAEIFAVGPARTPGVGVYHNMSELKPGHWMIVDPNGIRTYSYWRLVSQPHSEDEETTALKVHDLLKDTVERQLVSDVPVCTLLSGGLDSSALTAFATAYYQKQGQGQLTTYSVDYVDNAKYFKSNAFQPNADAPWIQKMSQFLGTDHHDIQFDTPELFEALEAAVIARDLPGMADVDGSLYLFCREIKKAATVAVSGEAADELFGGYPWFHREDLLNANTFPWAKATSERTKWLSPELRDLINPEAYVEERYRQALTEVPHLAGENQQQRKMREMSYLNISRFMPTLLDRKDRMSMAVGLEVRVPFCDHRLVEYVWNIPWGIKNAGNREKGILRKALKGILPEEILTRKKSPYPKTFNPNYFTSVKKGMLQILDDSTSPLLPLIDRNYIRQIAESNEEQSIPWFGQLMAGPQAFAYLIQVHTWLKHYNVSVKV
jgi:asparagine synthase (glutamine-hydrolysing)